MNPPVKILAVSGSMRQGSHSTLAMQIAMQAARDNGAEVQLLDLATLNLPVFMPDPPKDHPSVQEVLDSARWADAFILSTPDYHGGMSGAVKNYLDYLWKELKGKLFAYVCSSHEKGLTVMDQLRTTIRQCYAWSLPYGVTVNGSHDFDNEGNLLNESARKRLRMLGRDLATYGALLVQRYRQDLEAGSLETFARGLIQQSR